MQVLMPILLLFSGSIFHRYSKYLRNKLVPFPVLKQSLYEGSSSNIKVNIAHFNIYNILEQRLQVFNELKPFDLRIKSCAE